MSSEPNVMDALRALAQEKGIDEYDMLDKLEQSLASTYQRILDLDNKTRVTIDRETGRIYVYELVPIGEVDEEIDVGPGARLSPRPRAVGHDPEEPLAEEPQALRVVEPLIDHEIQEWRPGDEAEAIPMGEALGSWNRILAGHDHDVRITPGSESHNEFLSRVDRALTQIADDHAERTVLVFTHGGVIGRSFVTFLDLPPQRSLLGIRSRHTSITEWHRTVELGQPTWQLSRYNDVAHLDGDS